MENFLSGVFFFFFGGYILVHTFLDIITLFSQESSPQLKRYSIPMCLLCTMQQKP